MSKPEWLKKQWRPSGDMERVEELVRELGLNTVCREASCPNYCDCFSRGTATFLILGANCTRECGFCGVTHAAPGPVDPGEKTRVAEAVKKLGLNYVVITSVTRDDLEDGGAAEFAGTVREIRRLSPGTKIETLIPDFQGSDAALDLVLEAAPDVISHNIETVKELYDKVRPQADYGRSLRLLRRVADHVRQEDGSSRTKGDGSSVPEKKGDGSSVPGSALEDETGVSVPRHCEDGTDEAIHKKHIKCKSGLMVGVGEIDSQVRETIDDLRAAGCAFLTIGQYLRPAPANIPVEAYIEPEVFELWAEYARGVGFEFVASAPFVRSSYLAEEALEFSRITQEEGSPQEQCGDTDSLRLQNPGGDTDSLRPQPGEEPTTDDII